MQINWDLIKEKYPKAYKKFCFENKNKIITYGEDIYKIDIFDVYFTNRLNKLCYCDLEKFFDEQGIWIQINRFLYYGESREYCEYIDCKYYTVNIFYYKKKLCDSCTCKKCDKTCDRIACKEYDSHDEAKEQAIYKAFEILENQLSEDK